MFGLKYYGDRGEDAKSLREEDSTHNTFHFAATHFRTLCYCTDLMIINQKENLPYS